MTKKYLTHPIWNYYFNHKQRNAIFFFSKKETITYVTIFCFKKHDIISGWLCHAASDITERQYHISLCWNSSSDAYKTGTSYSLETKEFVESFAIWLNQVINRLGALLNMVLFINNTSKTKGFFLDFPPGMPKMLFF